MIGNHTLRKQLFRLVVMGLILHEEFASLWPPAKLESIWEAGLQQPTFVKQMEPVPSVYTRLVGSDKGWLVAAQDSPSSMIRPAATGTASFSGDPSFKPHNSAQARWAVGLSGLGLSDSWCWLKRKKLESVDQAESTYPGVTWTTRAPEEVGLARDKLDALRDLVGGRGCVVRHGYMVYTWGDPSKSADVASAVKPVISTLLLLAVQEGKIQSVDAKVADFEPRLKTLNGGKDAGITWRHLASQTSGYGLVEPPGKAYAYNDYALALYYDVLAWKVFQEDGTHVLKTRLADRLQFQDRYSFEAFGPNDRPGRLAISVRDFARFGLLYLRNGRWHDRQVLEPELVQLAISSPVAADTPLTQGQDADMLPNQRSLGGGKNQTPIGPGYYSFNWWLNRTDSMGRRLFTDAPPDTYVASGHGGRRMLWVIPSLDLVFSWNDGDVDDHDASPGNPDSKCNRAVRLIREAVVDKPDHGNSAVTQLGIEGTRFTLNGKSTFLLGISYYGALGAPEELVRRDLDDMQRCGFNWIRVWATWGAFGNEVSAVDGATGAGREPFLSKLKWLVAECDRRGMVVDVTLSRGNRVTGTDRLQTPAAHRRAVETLILALKPYRNWYLDLANERNIVDPRFVSFEELRELRELAKRLDPQRLITASHGGDISRDDLREYLLNVQVDFISPHRPRNAQSPEQTERNSRNYLAWMKEFGRTVPLHYQEPFRRGYGRWEPKAEDYLTDLRGAIAGGAAGWCLHNGDQRNKPDGEPRRSFDMRHKRLFDQLDEEESKAVQGLRALLETHVANPASRTSVAIVNGNWHINGQVTYRGAKAEGLLMNVRMVNAVFEDRNRANFDPNRNTEKFLAQIPDYMAHGVRAFTLNLQGGFPGYEGAVNSAFNPDGSLRGEYMTRVRRVIEACDRLGAVVILGCYYQRQDQILQDENAVRTGVVNVVEWIQRCGFSNVVLEIANEFPHKGFDHPILRTPEGQVELICLARHTAALRQGHPPLLVSTSGIGDGRLPESVARAADFLLIHFNGVPVHAIPERIAALKKFGKPIVCNEDDKLGEEAARAAEACVTSGASWGLMLKEANQYFPFAFHGAADDPVVYAKLKELTSP